MKHHSDFGAWRYAIVAATLALSIGYAVAYGSVSWLFSWAVEHWPWR